jgi:hypothetical protein
MCVVSMVHEYAQQNFPSIGSWTSGDLFSYAEVIRKLDALDKKFDQRECDDPAKQAFMNLVEERIAELVRKEIREALMGVEKPIAPNPTKRTARNPKKRAARKAKKRTKAPRGGIRQTLRS